MQVVKRYKIHLHVAGWAIFFIVPLLLSPAHELSANLNWGDLSAMVIRNMLWMGIFYLNLFYLTPVFLKKRGVLTFLLILVAIVMLVALINWQLHHLFSDERHEPMIMDGPPPFRNGPPPPKPFDLDFPGPLFLGILISFMVASVSSTLAFGADWAKAQADVKERALQKIASELAILKLQISPHFLFNTLNNIRWLVRTKSEQAEEAVVRLSQLMRYILYQTSAEKVPLEGEMEHVVDFISLQKLRHTDDQSFVFSLSGETSDKMIVPLLFIPIVENVFKYGDFQHGHVNRISIDVNGDRLILKTENKFVTSTNSTHPNQSGIGLSNVSKRLALHYQGRHLFTYREYNGIFWLELEILL